MTVDYEKNSITVGYTCLSHNIPKIKQNLEKLIVFGCFKVALV